MVKKIYKTNQVVKQVTMLLPDQEADIVYKKIAAAPYTHFKYKVVDKIGLHTKFQIRFQSDHDSMMKEFIILLTK